MFIVIMFFISILQPINITFAAYNDNILEDELQKQKQIESIFSEMNRLICEKAHTKYLLEQNIIDKEPAKNCISYIDSDNYFLQNEKVILEQKENLNKQLEYLGIHKIDTSNNNDLKLLDELKMTGIYIKI